MTKTIGIFSELDTRRQSGPLRFEIIYPKTCRSDHFIWVLSYFMLMTSLLATARNILQNERILQNDDIDSSRFNRMNVLE